MHLDGNLKKPCHIVITIIMVNGAVLHFQDKSECGLEVLLFVL